MSRRAVTTTDLRNNYGLYYLAMNPTFGYTYYQQVLMAPIMDKIVAKDAKYQFVMNIQPFRHSKTTLGTINFVPYYFGHHPTDTVLVLAYGHKRARAFGRAIRDIMQRSPLYTELFPESRIAASSRAADEFETVSGGHFFAGGFDTGINGIGGSGCIAEGVLVWTEHGHVPIEHVRVGDVVRTNGGWKPVTKAWCSGRKDIVQLALMQNGDVWLTPDHRVLTPYGWIAADMLRPHDVVLGVPTNVLGGGDLRETPHIVQRVSPHGSSLVFDLQVEDDHMFTANSVFVHNCIIDDPHKNKEDVTSDAHIARWRSIYDNVISNRLEPGAWVLVNSTRWSNDDFMGWRIKEDGAFDYFTGERYTDNDTAVPRVIEDGEP